MKLAIIGGGPGGYVAAIRAAQLGAEVTLIEKDALGGTCLNIGCIPTKALLDSAHIYHLAKSSLDVGVEAKPVLHWDKVQSRRQGVTNQLVNGVKGLMNANKIKVISGEASFKSKTTIEVLAKDGIKTSVLYDKCIIATGSVPVVPPIKGANSSVCIDSTKALSLDKVPKSMVIVGGGVIGIEMACAYNEFGTEITVVEMADSILPNMDKELAGKLNKILESKGIKIYTKAKVDSIEADGTCKVSQGGKEILVKGEKVLLCSGRKSYTDKLNLETIGLKNDRGIQVNDYMETSVSGIYAIGDCNGKMMLAHAASEQGVVAAENAMGNKHTYNGNVCPAGVYSFPEFAGVGITEEIAKEKGIEYETATFPTMANGRSLIARETNGAIKVIVGKKHKEVLGVHILSEHATELIAEGALAIQMECTVDEIINTIHAHPTLNECFHEASLGVENRMIHMPNKKR